MKGEKGSCNVVSRDSPSSRSQAAWRKWLCEKGYLTWREKKICLSLCVTQEEEESIKAGKADTYSPCKAEENIWRRRKEMTQKTMYIFNEETI